MPAASVPTFKKICLHCGQGFVAYLQTTDYCSQKCASLAYKERKRIECLKETSLEVRENQRLLLLDKNWLTISDAAKLLQMSRTTLYKILQRKGVELRKFTARTVRVAREYLEHISETRETYINTTVQGQEENLGRWMSKKQVMETYGISDSGMYQILKRRGIKPHRIGNASFYDKDEMYRVFHKVELEGVNEWYTFAELMEATGLTRKTIVAILTGISPKTFSQFQLNPEEFIIRVGNIINDEKAMAVIQKIAYEKTFNTYHVDIFAETTLRGKLGVNAIASAKSLYDLVVVDSAGVEKNFAEALEKEDDVVVYTKLPRGFYINTPMGHYNPDWAVAFREGSVKHIYFVAETKGNEWQRSQLRGAEDCKLECAARHFEAISQSGNVIYGVARDYKTLYDKVMK